jgi:hypothetical protein
LQEVLEEFRLDAKRHAIQVAEDEEERKLQGWLAQEEEAAAAAEAAPTTAGGTEVVTAAIMAAAACSSERKLNLGEATNRQVTMGERFEARGDRRSNLGRWTSKSMIAQAQHTGMKGSRTKDIAGRQTRRGTAQTKQWLSGPKLIGDRSKSQIRSKRQRGCDKHQNRA